MNINTVIQPSPALTRAAPLMARVCVLLDAYADNPTVRQGGLLPIIDLAGVALREWQAQDCRAFVPRVEGPALASLRCAECGRFEHEHQADPVPISEQIRCHWEQI